QGPGILPFAMPEESTTRDLVQRWERYAWVAGVLFVIALATEIVVAVGVELSQNDSAAKIANGLHAHEKRLIVIACLSVVYAVTFVIYLSALHNRLRGDTDRTRV